MIKTVKFVSIPVLDQKRALAFYVDKLGMTVLTEQPFDEKQHWIELKIPGGETRVVLFTPPGQEDRIGSFMNVVFSTDNVEKTYEEYKRRGVEFVQPPAKEDWGTSALFKDSEGNTFCLSSK